MKLLIKPGTTSVLVRIFIADSTSTTGAGLTGLAFNTSGLVCYLMRDDDGNAGGTAVSLVTATRGTWTSGGFVEKDATNCPGWYEFGIPNAALASGSRSVDFHFKGAANMAPLPMEIDLGAQVDVVAWNDVPLSTTNPLPNAAPAANGGLPTVDANNNIHGVQPGIGTGQINAAGGKVPATLAAGDVTGNLAADVQTIKTQAVTCPAPVAVGAFVGNATHAITVDSSGNVTFNNTTIATATNLTNAPTVGDFTATMKASLNASTPASVVGAVGSVTGNVGGNVAGSVGSVLGSVASVVGNVGGNVVGSVASVAGAVGSVNGNVGGNVAGSVASVTNVVSANVTKVNGTTVNGSGTSLSPWGP